MANTKQIFKGILFVASLLVIGKVISDTTKQAAQVNPARREGESFARGVLRCRDEVRYRLPGAEIPSVIDGLPAQQRDAAGVIRWSETAVHQGQRVRYRCALAPDGRLAVGHADGSPWLRP